MIEQELRHYLVRKQEYADMRDDIILKPGGLSGVKVQAPQSDFVLSKVLQLQSGVLIEIGRRLAAIEYALDKVKHNPIRYKLIQFKYFEDNLTNQGIMQALFIGQDTFYRWRKEFIQLIADRLGWEI